MELKMKNNEVRFDQIKSGEFFQYKNHVFKKINNDGTEYNSINIKEDIKDLMFFHTDLGVIPLGVARKVGSGLLL